MSLYFINFLPTWSRFCDELDALDDAGDDLVFDAWVFALGVFADRHNVDAVVQRLVALNRLARTNVGEQVELWKQNFSYIFTIFFENT